jgi:hypothetical protein
VTAKHVCPSCHGVLHAPPSKLARMIDVHEDSCPGVVKMRRKPAPVAQLAEASGSSPESAGSTPAGGTEQPRKRWIKRIVV